MFASLFIFCQGYFFEREPRDFLRVQFTHCVSLGIEVEVEVHNIEVEFFPLSSEPQPSLGGGSRPCTSQYVTKYFKV